MCNLSLYTRQSPTGKGLNGLFCPNQFAKIVHIFLKYE